MEQQHPVVSAVAETMADMAFFGFFIFFMLRPYIVDFSFFPLAAGLLLLRLFNSLLLQKNITIGIFTVCNLFLGLVLLFFSMKLLVLTAFHLLPAGLYASAFVVLTIRTVYFSAAASARSVSPVTVDCLFLLCLITSIWKHFSQVPGLPSLMTLILLALACSIGRLSLRHVSRISGKQDSGLPLLITGGLGALFTLSLAAAAVFEKTFSNSFIQAVLGVFTAVKNFIKLLWNFLGSILMHLIEALPDGETEGYEEPYQMPDGFLENIEEQAAHSNPKALAVFLTVLFIAAAVGTLYCLIKKGVFRRRIPVKTTVKNTRRYSYSSRGFFCSTLQAIAVFFRSAAFLFFRPNHIQALLIRADWYGKRHLHPRRKGETVKEYLTRLNSSENSEGDDYLKKAVVLLSDYGDRYLYGIEQTAVQLQKSEIQIIKKAFPLV